MYVYRTDDGRNAFWVRQDKALQCDQYYHDCIEDPDRDGALQDISWTEWYLVGNDSDICCKRNCVLYGFSQDGQQDRTENIE